MNGNTGLNDNEIPQSVIDKLFKDEDTKELAELL